METITCTLSCLLSDDDIDANYKSINKCIVEHNRELPKDPSTKKMSQLMVKVFMSKLKGTHTKGSISQATRSSAVLMENEIYLGVANSFLLVTGFLADQNSGNFNLLSVNPMLLCSTTLAF